MPASKKPRKKYRPKGYTVKNPVDYVLSGFMKISQDDQVRLQCIAHDALKLLVSGTGTREHWQLVTDALNMAFALDEIVFQGEYLDDIHKAQMAHAACGNRFIRLGKFGYYGPELLAVNYALKVHDEQLPLITTENMEQALAAVKRELARGNVIMAKNHAPQGAVSANGG